MRPFYQNANRLDQLRNASAPTADDLNEVLSVIADDDDLAEWFYAGGETSSGPATAWVPLLRQAGQFEELGDAAVRAKRLWRLKAKYLAERAPECPDEIFQIITEIHPFDSLTQARFLDALLNLPTELGVRASWIIWDFLSDREYKVWVWVGQPIAKFMVKVTESSLDLAFRIARYLLEIWSDAEQSDSSIREPKGRFESASEYSDLVFRYFKELWEISPFRGATLLVRTLDKYLEEINRSKKHDVSTHFHISVENLDKIERVDRDYETVLVAGICQAGKAVIAKEGDKVPEFLRVLRGTGKQIFKRIEMHLLRFVPKGTENARIEEIIGDPELFDDYAFQYEYALLVKDKVWHISEEVRNQFLNMVAQTKIESPDGFGEWFRKVHGREYAPDDLQKYEDRMRATKLYLVGDAFPTLYDDYRRRAGAEEDELKPRPRVGTARCISPTEGSPITVSALAKMDPNEAFAYLGDSTRWKVASGVEHFFEPKEALCSTFERVVQDRIATYVAKEQAERVVCLDSEFATSYFHGTSNAIRGGEWKREFWEPLLIIARDVVAAYKDDLAYRDAFQAMLFGLHDAFGEGANSMAFNAMAVETFWMILEPLVRYGEPPVNSEHERDPMQLRCSSVNGTALGQVVCLGILCKRDYSKLFEEKIREPIRGLLQKVATEVRRPEVMCIFGVDFARLVWLDEEWISAHIDAIFASDVWDAVWGTYVSWGRPSRKAFDLLYEKGKYRQAVEAIGQDSYWKFPEKVEEGLSDHLMIALFNGWLDSDPDGLLAAFLEKAPASLRGHAAYFLTSGFEALRKEPDEEVSKRLKKYWEQRLVSIEKDRDSHKEEAVQFLYWAKNSPLKDNETLVLLERTVDLAERQVGGSHFPTDFFEGIRDMVVGNEVPALRCLSKLIEDRKVADFTSLFEEPIDAVFGHVLELPPESPNIRDIWLEAMGLADGLGRLRVYKFRPVYDELRKRMTTHYEAG
jgi:hypothetical protein